MTSPSMSGLDAIRLLLAVGFRVGRSSGGEAALERDGRIVYVAPERDLSNEALGAILEAARIQPEELGTNPRAAPRARHLARPHGGLSGSSHALRERSEEGGRDAIDAGSTNRRAGADLP